MAGVIAGILPLFSLTGGSLGGYLADRLGRSKFIKFSLLGSSLSFLLWFVAANFSANSVIFILFTIISAANGFFRV